MVKYISLLRLKSGVDPEEAYKVWIENHSVWAKGLLLPEVKRYTVNRVIHTLGETEIYGFPEFEFDDLESAKRALNRTFSAPPDKFLTEYAMSMGRVIAQEVEITLPK